MRLLFSSRAASRGFNSFTPMRRGLGNMPHVALHPILSQYTTALSHHRAWHTTATPQPLAPRPNPTPWQWRTHPSWARQSLFAFQAPRAAMAGLASVPSATVPRAAVFTALGEIIVITELKNHSYTYTS